MKKLFYLFLCTCVCIMATFAVSAEILSGECGENLEWSLDTESGELVISGNGDMLDFDSRSDGPWYEHRTYIKKVKVSDGVTSVGKYAFHWAYSNLSEVALADSVKTINYQAFSHLTSLTDVDLGEGVETIGMYAFAHTSIGKIVIPASVKIIKTSAFNSCSTLADLTFAEGVETIEEFAFDSCTNLKTVTIPNSVTELSGDVFAFCDALEEVTVGDGVKEIPSELFRGCESLKKVSIGSGAEYIGSDAFNDCYPGYVDLAPFTRLKRASIGSSVAGYSNTNLTEVSVENCEALEYMNVENCPALVQALSLSNNIMLKELYTKGSGVTGVTFAPGARLRTADLNAIVSLTAKSLNYVEALTMESYDNLSTLVIEESPAIDSLQLVEIAENIVRVRLIKVDWMMDNSAALVRISKIGGVDDDGYNTEHAVLTGDAHVDYISETRLSVLTAAFPGLTITHSELLPEHTVRFILDDGSVWDEQTVEHGSSAERPADPTKASTVDKVFTFRGWSGSFANILQDTTLSPVFTESVRTYTVTFMNGSKVVQTSVVDCYGGVDYTGPDLEKTGHLWTGWDAQTNRVTSDMVVNAVFEAPALPAQVADMTQFDYLFSDDPADRSAYTIGEIYAICAAGLASTYMAVGDKLKITMTEAAKIYDDYIIFQLYGFNHFKLEDGSNFANAVFGMMGVLNTTYQMNSSNTNAGGWPATKMRTYLNQTVLYALPTVWRNVIKSVQVLSSAGETSPEIVTSIDKLFLFSNAEVGGSVTTVPYCNEVAEGADSVQLPIFTDNASRIKKHYNGTGSAANWWLRSPNATGATGFSGVGSSGNVYYNNGATGTIGVAFGFCI